MRSAFSYLQILKRAGFELMFAPWDLQSAGRHSDKLHALGVATLSAPEWTSLQDVVGSFAPQCDLVLLYRAPFAVRLFDLTKTAAPDTSILFHAVDLHFLRMEREAELNGVQARRESALEMRRIELDLINRADASIVVSTYERDLLRELVPQAPVHRIPIFREMPRRSPKDRLRWHARGLGHRLGLFGRWVNGLDPGLRRRSALVFLGGFAHSPNGDAIKWFVGEVWPLLQARGFSHRLIIAGSHIDGEVAALESELIEVRGYVEDLATLFATCRLSIAPLRYGAGMKGKIIESLSYGVPVVATSVAAEGPGLRDNETVLVADSPPAICNAIIRLYEDDDLWQFLSRNGYRYVEDHLSIDVGATTLVPLVDDLVARTRAKRGT